VLQEAPIQQTEQQTTNVLQDTEQGNVQLDRATKSAARARKLRKWCFIIIVLIVIIAALGIGLGVGLTKKATSTA
jgi:syntaxin 1B/2/3